MRRLKVLFLVALAASTAALLLGYEGSVLAQAPPPIPHFFKGTVRVGVDGQIPPGGHTLIARIETRDTSYESEPVDIVGGQFQGLGVGPQGSRDSGRTDNVPLGRVDPGRSDSNVQARIPLGGGRG